MAVDHNNPQSRNEEILIATIDGNEYNKAPQSRMEELLLELKETIEEGGGGGGTSNYENLSNQPQINGETLIGDKTGADLGLVDAVEGKSLSTNDYDDNEKAAVAAATSAISAMKDGTDLDSFGDVEVALLDKADTADLGTAATKDSTNSVTSGSTDLVESGAVKDAIDAAVSAAYHHAGTKTVAQLTHDLLIAANEGNVYNITDSGTTTSDFIEGIGKTIDEGSNVGICKVGNTYMFDLLSGFVDTSNFVQKSVTAGLLKNDGTVNDEIEGDVSALKSGLTDLSDHVNGDAVTYPYADVITINDAVPSNLADCSVKVEPVQDLHGYDKPWVGGAGKNKFNIDSSDNQSNRRISTGTGQTYTSEGYTSSYYIEVKANTEYTLTTSLNFASYFCWYDSSKTIIDGATWNSGSSKTTPENAKYVRFDFLTGIQTVQFEEGSTATTFMPYENICPISGHTEAAVTVADDDTDPTVTNTYTLALGDTIYGGTVDFKTGVMTVTHGFAEFNDTTGISLYYQYDGTTYNHAVFLIRLSYMRLSSAWDTDGLSSNIAEVKVIADADEYNNFTIRRKNNTRELFLFAPTYMGEVSLTDLANILNNTHMQICYDLETPTTVQLTPEQIQLLQGTNTLYASTGDISVTVNGVSGAIGAVQTQANATDNALAQLAADIAEQLPDAPTTDGAYVLTVTVTDGAATYSWDSAT